MTLALAFIISYIPFIFWMVTEARQDWKRSQKPYVKRKRLPKLETHW